MDRYIPSKLDISNSAIPAHSQYNYIGSIGIFKPAARKEIKKKNKVKKKKRHQDIAPTAN